MSRQQSSPRATDRTITANDSQSLKQKRRLLLTAGASTVKLQSVTVDREFRSLGHERLERTEQTLVKLGDDSTTIADDVMVMLERAGEIPVFVSRMGDRLGKIQLNQDLERPVDARQAYRTVAKENGQLRRRHGPSLSK